MSQEYIEIRHARENNLKNVSLRIPKRQITIFTGVSGSGKSSIVFDTIATEAQRLLNENFSMFIRNFLPRYSQPDADAILRWFAVNEHDAFDSMESSCQFREFLAEQIFFRIMPL